MKYLKTYKLFESIISPQDLKDFISDISADLSDNGFTLSISDDIELNENDPGSNNYNIYINKKASEFDKKEFYKWSDVKHAVEHIMNFAESNDYFCSVNVHKPKRKPKPGFEPKSSGNKYSFSTSGLDKKPNDDDYFFGSINIRLMDRNIDYDVF